MGLGAKSSFDTALHVRHQGVHGAGQADGVKGLLKAEGFKEVRTVKDVSGIERVALARKG